MKNRDFFKSIYFAILLFGCCIVLTVTTIMGVLYTRNMKNIIQNNSRNRTEKIKNQLDEVYQKGINLAVSVFEDSEILPVLYGKQVKNNEVIRAIKRLNKYKNSSDFVESIYVFNRQRDRVYSTYSEGISSTVTFFDLDVIEFFNGKRDWPLSKPIARAIREKENSLTHPTENNVYTFICTDGINTKTGYYDNVVVVNLRMEQSLFIEDFAVGENETFIISAEGRLMSPFSTYAIGELLVRYPFIQKIIDSEEKTDWLNIMYQNKKYVLQYEQMEKMQDWYLVNLQEYSDVFQPIKRIVWVTAVLIVLLLIIGSVFAFLISLKMMHPIDRMLSQFQKLQSQYKSNTYVLYNMALKSLLFMDNKISVSELEEIFEKTHCKLTIESKTFCLQFQILNISDKWKLDNQKEREIIKFAVKNVSEEIANQYYQSTAVLMDHLEVVLISNVDKALNQEKLQDMIDKIVKSLKQYCHIDVDVVVGNVVEDMCFLPYEYQKVQNAAQYFKLCHKHVLTVRDVEEIENKEFIYPIVEQKQYIQSLLKGDSTNANQIVCNMLEYGAKYAVVHYNFLLINMSFNAWKAAKCYIVEKQLTLKEEIPMLFYDQLQKAPNVEEVKELFKKWNSQICEICKMASTSSVGENQADYIEEAVRMIEEQFVDADMNIQQISLQIGISAAYLGRQFNRQKGISITDYLLQVRMQHAEAYLLDGENIQNLPEKCGFSNLTYFYRMFKKYYGMPPKEYLKMCKND